jgi:hypothetical protein
LKGSQAFLGVTIKGDSPFFLGNKGRIFMDRETYQSRLNEAISVLQQDLPLLFARDMNYDIYSNDIYFKDPVNTFKWKFNYRIIFWTLRFHARLFMKEIYFDVHDIKRIQEDEIRVDWTVRGTLRLPWAANLFFKGYSLYKLNEKGLIYDHRDTWDRSPKAILKQFLPTTARE